MMTSMAGAPDYSDALMAALRAVRPLDDIEPCALEHARGRVLAEPVKADRDLPPFDRAQMDGYALRAAELAPGRSFPVAATVHAGAPPDVHVPPGQCVAIATGAALPRGLDAVIPHELSDRENPVRFSRDGLEPGSAVHRRGADARTGDVVIETGTILQPHHMGIAAAVGCPSLKVRRRPRAIILTSGDEVVPTDSIPLPHQIRNSNAIMARHLLDRLGCEVIAHQHVRDERETTIFEVKNALLRCDLLITIGGISAGERDHFPVAFDAASVKLPLKKAAIQPGGPITIGRAGHGQAVVALPGNPVSVLACACLFAWPVVRVMLGLDPTLPWQAVTLRQAVKPNAKRRAFRPARLHNDGSATVPQWAGSGDLAHTAATDGLLELPVQDAPVPAGTSLRFLPWP